MPADTIAVYRGAAWVAGDQNGLLAGSKNARPFGDINNRANDSQIYRVVAEKVDPPFANVHRSSGGGLLKIRRLSPAHR